MGPRYTVLGTHMHTQSSLHPVRFYVIMHTPFFLFSSLLSIFSVSNTCVVDREGKKVVLEKDEDPEANGITKSLNSIEVAVVTHKHTHY